MASWWSVRFAYADHLYSEASLASTLKAVALEPYNPTYRARLAELLNDKDAERSLAELQFALRLNPRHAKTWIELGLRAEFRGDYADAERCFLEAAREDRRYLPRWTLAGFYFRRSQPAPFWRWAKGAAAMSFGDPFPLFRLCLGMTPDASAIPEALGLARPQMVAKFLEFVISEGRIDDLCQVEELLAGFSRAEDTPIRLAACDRLLAVGRFEDGLRIWNRLCEGKLLPYPPISAGVGPELTNPDWSFPPLSNGFDWRLAQLEGVSLSREKQPPALKVQFSGRQPESCDLLSQLVPVVESSSYRVRFEFRTLGIAPGTGLGWKVIDSSTGRNLVESADSLSRDQDAVGTVYFRTPCGARTVRLSLAYQRAIGTPRIEGTIWLRKMELLRLD